MTNHPHRRLNPLTGEWVLVSPHRTQRPWQGQQESAAGSARPAYDAACYLCPGNTRSGGQQNPDYDGTFIFTNDFSALLPDIRATAPAAAENADSLFCAEPENGICKVMCFSPRHDLSIPSMNLADVASVIHAWTAEYRTLKTNPDIRYAQIFENKGPAMGCSNPHPHCQIWASGHLPDIVAREQRHQHDYLSQHAEPLLLAYARHEAGLGERVVYENEHFIVVVPYWAVWPFETLVLPKRHRTALDELDDTEIVAFADAYRSLTQIYDGVFDCEFPYSAGIHQAPTFQGTHDAWQLHMHFYPPLLRSATVKKFMVGYEMLASPQRDITAESAAETLRRVRDKILPKH